jgi:outer membrane protein TolC
MKKYILISILLTVVMPSVLKGQDSLDVYLKTAFENNPGLLSSYEGFSSMIERAEQAGFLQDPTLTAGYFISPIETRVGPQQARFSLSQMFPWFGTLKLRREQMSKQAEVAFWQYAETARQLAREVRSSYYDLWVTHKLIALEKEQVTLINSLESLATTRFRSGEGRLADVLRVQLDQKASQNTLEKQQEILDYKIRQFFLLLNSEKEVLYLPDTIALTIPAVAQAEELEEHPMIQANLARSEAASTSIEVAQKQGYPSLGVGLDYILIGKREDMVMDDNGKNAFAPMVTIGLPIYRKKYASMKAEAIASQRQYSLAAESTKIELTSSLVELEYTITRALEDLKLYDEQIELAERMLSLTRTDFASDRTDFDEILSYQEKLLSYQRVRLVRYGELLKSVALYDYLTGDNPALITEDYDEEN